MVVCFGSCFVPRGKAARRSALNLKKDERGEGGERREGRTSPALPASLPPLPIHRQVPAPILNPPLLPWPRTLHPLPLPPRSPSTAQHSPRRNQIQSRPRSAGLWPLERVETLFVLRDSPRFGCRVEAGLGRYSARRRVVLSAPPASETKPAPQSSSSTSSSSGALSRWGDSVALPQS